MEAEQPPSIWPRAVIHVDLDAFYASVEQRDDPGLRGQPIAVGGGRDSEGRAVIGRGVVSAASYEARKFGIHSAMPLATAVRLCPQLRIIPVDFPKYRSASKVVFEILHQVTPLIEPLSLDEAFLDITASQRRFGSPLQIAKKLRAQIKEQTQLDASFGIATCRTVAKIASDLEKPRGLVLVEPGREREFLAPLGLRKLPGLGPAAERGLEGLGVSTLGQLAALERDVVMRRLGDKAGASIWERAQGIDSNAVLPPGPPKSISREETFAADVTAASVCESRLRDLAADVGKRLRAQGLSASTVTLKLRLADFTTKTRQVAMKTPTASDVVIGQAAIELFQDAWQGMPIRLLGVGVSNFDVAVQGELFSDAHNDLEQETIDRALDALRTRFGDGVIQRGSGPALADLDSRGEDLRDLNRAEG